ncbi:hypothetical protein PanWU01x14_030020, partial [Parasponia andersonii]
NNELMRIELDLLVERHEQSQLQIASYQQLTARYYDSKVKSREFEVGDLVLQQVLPNNKKHGASVFGISWERPYIIDAIIQAGMYKLGFTGG